MLKRVSTLLATLATMVATRAAAPTDDLSRQVAVLHESGLLEDVVYWTTHAIPGQACAGDRVAALLVRCGRFYGEAEDLPSALDILTARDVIWNDYWEKNARTGGSCRGEYVATVIGIVARHATDRLLIARYAPPEGVLTLPAPSAFEPPPGSPPATEPNLTIGTQTFGASYQFTEQPKLVETAVAMQAMGATVIKFQLGHRYFGENGNIPDENPAIRSLTDLARDEPSHRKVLDMPFRHIVLWAHCLGNRQLPSWQGREGFTAAERETEYREIKALTAHLLKTYSGTGKTFYLGHWEGDGWLRRSVHPENDARVTPEAIAGFTEWLNLRQRAVDDAKRETTFDGVQVWHYTEVNHVWLAVEGRPALVNTILPNTTVDLVSYSSYDTAQDPAKLKAALNYIQTQLPPKDGITGRRVFIGEYGFPTCRHTPAEQDRLTRNLLAAALEWGCPLALYWELYNNEVEDGEQRGFWMIDDKGVRQPVYHTHHQFYAAARDYAALYRRENHSLPDHNAFRRWAVEWLRQQRPD
jgi:hypothetical protein